MNDLYCRMTAEKFLDALGASPSLFNEWISISRSDPSAIASFVREALKLEATPSESDIKAMADHAAQMLQERLGGGNANDIRAAGNIFAQSGEVPRMAGDIFAQSGELPRMAGDIFAQSGELPRMAGDIFAQSGELPQRTA